MNHLSQYFIFLLFRLLVLIFKILPWPLMYAFSGVVYRMLFYGLRYRRKVARQNLERLFPDKSAQWKDDTLKAFYRNLSDIFLESLRGYDMSSDQLLARFTLENPETLRQIEEKYPRIIIASAHCGNWEWGAMAAPLMMKHTTFGLYKPIANPYIDGWMRRRRAVQGMHLIPISATSSMFRRNDAMAAYFFITDQHPSRRANAIWVSLLGYPTAWLHGVEKYARLYELPVFYFGIRRVSRGRYQVFIREVALQPSSLPFGEITRRYVKTLEQVILEDPSNWLWTHRRWKYNPSAADLVLE